jgi:hypothetical protein
MAKDNVELVYRAFDAVNRRDIDAFLALMSPEIDFEATVLEARSVDGTTISRMLYRGTGGGSSAPFEESIWLVSNWQDGKSVWAKSFRDRAEAVEAAGLNG